MYRPVTDQVPKTFGVAAYRHVHERDLHVLYEWRTAFEQASSGLLYSSTKPTHDDRQDAVTIVPSSPAKNAGVLRGFEPEDVIDYLFQVERRSTITVEVERAAVFGSVSTAMVVELSGERLLAERQETLANIVDIAGCQLSDIVAYDDARPHLTVARLPRDLDDDTKQRLAETVERTAPATLDLARTVYRAL